MHCRHKTCRAVGSALVGFGDGISGIRRDRAGLADNINGGAGILQAFAQAAGLFGQSLGLCGRLLGGSGIATGSSLAGFFALQFGRSQFFCGLFGDVGLLLALAHVFALQFPNPVGSGSADVDFLLQRGRSGIAVLLQVGERFLQRRFARRFEFLQIPDLLVDDLLGGQRFLSGKNLLFFELELLEVFAGGIQFLLSIDPGIGVALRINDGAGDIGIGRGQRLRLEIAQLLLELRKALDFRAGLGKFGGRHLAFGAHFLERLQHGRTIGFGN
ncbi:MAG: hypothetical protein BWY57_01606 [Betaproteobacteria bacterium ADurb.Bin341]|nr:MAG: hypothetical protein BWY57_01606 [Betaproteobacteria bacterium ADurb.Bin341]